MPDERVTDKRRVYQARHRAAGLCTNCPAANGGYAMCARCRGLNAVRVAAWRARGGPRDGARQEHRCGRCGATGHNARTCAQEHRQHG